MSEREEIQQLKAEKEALEARVKELEKAVDYYERDVAMMKRAPIDWVNTVVRLEKAMKVVEAAKKFIDADNAHEGDWDALVDALTAFEKEGEKK